MTREEQIKEAARQRADQYDHPSKWSDTYYGFIDGAKWADSHPQWIPVEEKLPEENTTPLVRMDLTDKFGEETILYDVVVFDGNGFHAPYKITHWMKIVSHRKEDKNE